MGVGTIVRLGLLLTFNYDDDILTTCIYDIYIFDPLHYILVINIAGKVGIQLLVIYSSLRNFI